MSQISILGCGWLGLPLAKSLIKKGFSVKGSTTSLEKIPTLNNAGVKAFEIELTEKGVNGDVKMFLQNSEILIIDIPPKLRGNSTENFVNKIQHLIPFIENASVEKIIFISSTSVYAVEDVVVTENSKPQPDTESGKQLLEAEMILQNNLNFKTTVIRFGGLIGDDRHPVYYLAGKQNLENPKAAVNLIDQKDCIGIIERIIALDVWNQSFNAVAPFHPNRKEYYTQKAVELGLPLPGFVEDSNALGKIIDANWLISELQYTFQKPNL